MRIEYSPDIDVLYLSLHREPGEFSNEVLETKDGLTVIFDIDAQGRIGGIEILDASKRLDLAALLPVEIIKP